MTPRMRQLLLYVAARAESGEVPSFEEMRQHLGCKSKSNVHRILTELEADGYIRRKPARPRSIELTGKQLPVLNSVIAPPLAREHLMWAMETQMDGREPVIQPLSLCFMESDLGKRMALDPTIPHRRVRVRVIIEEVKE